MNTDNNNGLLKHYHFSIPLGKVLLKIKVNIQSSYMNIKLAHVFSSERCCENKLINESNKEYVLHSEHLRTFQWRFPDWMNGPNSILLKNKSEEFKENLLLLEGGKQSLFGGITSVDFSTALFSNLKLILLFYIFWE